MPKLEQLDIRPNPDLPDVGKRRVFISYAWGDNKDDMGRKRGKLVEKLCASLTEVEIIRDINEMRMGQLISDFMLRIGRGGRVIVILSDKYLRSPYCLTELHYLYQGSLGDKEEFLKRVVPLTLDDVKLDDWHSRNKWAQYWQRLCNEMEESIKKSPSSFAIPDFLRYKLIKKWHVDVSDMLAFVSDKLSPRGFDSIVADDFRALREMLGK
jgi:internalin A